MFKIFLTNFRSLTHGDVRYEDPDADVTDLGVVPTSKSNDAKTTATNVTSFRSLFNVASTVQTSKLVGSKKDSASAADLVSRVARFIPCDTNVSAVQNKLDYYLYM